MSPKKLRLLAECIETGFYPDSDRKKWADDLRGMAKDMERRSAEFERIGSLKNSPLERLMRGADPKHEAYRTGWEAIWGGRRA
jgi:hypothetical protein